MNHRGQFSTNSLRLDGKSSFHLQDYGFYWIRCNAADCVWGFWDGERRRRRGEGWEEACACTREGREDGLSTHRGKEQEKQQEKPKHGWQKEPSFSGWPCKTLESWVQVSHHLLKLPYGFWTGPAVPSPAGWWAAMSHGNLLHLGSKS